MSIIQPKNSSDTLKSQFPKNRLRSETIQSLHIMQSPVYFFALDSYRNAKPTILVTVFKTLVPAASYKILHDRLHYKFIFSHTSQPVPLFIYLSLFHLITQSPSVSYSLFLSLSLSFTFILLSFSLAFLIFHFYLTLFFSRFPYLSLLSYSLFLSLSLSFTFILLSFSLAFLIFHFYLTLFF